MKYPSLSRADCEKLVRSLNRCLGTLDRDAGAKSADAAEMRNLFVMLRDDMERALARRATV